ncbi:MAG: WD40 repeat domain-containing protein [Planctomycetota bacterium]|nr:WD40 repeat domain-containing protein [Planctomycetota bacterium]
MSIETKLRRHRDALGKQPRRVLIGAAGLVAIVLGIIIYDKATAWSPRLVLDAPGDNIPLAFAPDSVTLATENQGRVKLWDTRDGRLVKTLENPSGRTIFHGRFTPDGKTFLAITYAPGANPIVVHVDILDVESGKSRGSVATKFGGFHGLAINEQGRVARVLVGDNTPAHQVVDIDLATAHVLKDRTIEPPPTRPKSGLGPMSPDGRFAVSVLDPPSTDPSKTDTILIWDLDDDREVTRLPLPADTNLWRVAFIPGARSLMLARDDGTIERLDLTADLRPIPPPREFGRHSRNYLPYELVFSTDGGRLASGGIWRGGPGLSLEYLRVLGVWLTGRRNYEPPYELLILNSAGGPPIGRLTGEGRAVFSPDGRSMATIVTDGPEGVTVIRDLPGK